MKEKNRNNEATTLTQTHTSFNTKISSVIIRPKNIMIVVALVSAFILYSYQLA